MKIKVWDLPTRLFHWTLFLAVLGSFISADEGGNSIEWHACLLYTSPSPRDYAASRMPSSA